MELVSAVRRDAVHAARATLPGSRLYIISIDQCSYPAIYNSLADRPHPATPTRDNRTGSLSVLRCWIYEDTAENASGAMVRSLARNECAVGPDQTSLPLDRVTATD